MKSIFTLSNFLSLSRVILLFPFMHYLSLETQKGNWIALLLCLMMMLTDFLDGIVARRRHAVTTFGKYLDPVADKICVFATAIYLSFYRKNLAEWFTLLIIIKDVFILAGGAYLVLWKKLDIQSAGAGKWSVFIVALTFAFHILNYKTLGTIFLYLSLIMIIYSTWFYFARSVKLLRNS